jgi:hypothetical protein
MPKAAKPAENSNNLPAVSRKRKLTLDDVRFIASHVAKGNTESEAALMLNLRPIQWFNWKLKHKNSLKYGEILSRLKGDYIAGNIRQIEKAANGTDGIRHDWRAADRLNAIIAPERFAQRAEAPVAGVTIDVGSLGKLIDKVYGAASGAVVECPAADVAALPAGGQEPARAIGGSVSQPDSLPAQQQPTADTTSRIITEPITFEVCPAGKD